MIMFAKSTLLRQSCLPVHCSLSSNSSVIYTFACSAFLRHFHLWPPPSWRHPTSRRCWTGGLTEKKFDSRHLVKLWILYKEGSKYRLTLRQQILEDNIDAAVVGIIVALKHHSSPPLIWVGLVTSWWPNLSWVKNLKSGEVFNDISIYNICVPPNILPLPCTALIPSPDNPSCPVLKSFLPSFSASWFISENITCRVHCAFHHLFVPLEFLKATLTLSCLYH